MIQRIKESVTKRWLGTHKRRRMAGAEEAGRDRESVGWEMTDQEQGERSE